MREKAQSTLKDFVLYTTPGYIVGPPHEILFEALEKVIAGLIQYLMVWMPPQNGKSTVVSKRLPAFDLGHHPDKFVTMASYEEALATDFGRELKNLVKSQIYKNVFPGVELQEDSQAAGRWNTNFGGGFHSAGVGSGLTGRPSNFGIVDDPHKDRQEADSPIMRERVKRWWKSTFMTRQWAGAPIIVCQTRWHHDDLCGWLLKQPDKSKWMVLDLKARAEKGDILGRDLRAPLWPEVYDATFLDKREVEIGPEEFEALYQQNPSMKAGKLFKRDNWRFWNLATLPEQWDDILVSMDANIEEGEDNSETVAAVWARSGPNFYLLDLIHGSWDFDVQIVNFRVFCWKHPNAKTKLVEKKANGAAIINTLEKEIGGILPINPGSKSKEQRAKAVSPYHVAGNFYLPEDKVRHPWVDWFINQHAEFPHGDRDDAVDTTTQAVNWWMSDEGGTYAIGFDNKTESEAVAEIYKTEGDAGGPRQIGDMTVERVSL